MRGISMGSFCKALIGRCNSSIPWKVIWGPRAPTVMASFVWCLAQGKILTTDHLIHRKNVIVSWCWMCKQDGELLLFVTCGCILHFQPLQVVINWNFLSCDGKDNSRTSTGKELTLYVYFRSKVLKLKGDFRKRYQSGLWFDSRCDIWRGR